MWTVVLGPRPAELAALPNRRRALGQDLYDGVWAGECHVAPAPGHRHALRDGEDAAVLRPLARRAGPSGSGASTLGRPEDFRVPDRGPTASVPATSAFRPPLWSWRSSRRTTRPS